jgi:hypothetical protein
VAESAGLADALRGRYTIERELGEGGMATDGLEALIAMPYTLSSGRLGVEPGLARLRNNVRFRRLLKSAR